MKAQTIITRDQAYKKMAESHRNYTKLLYYGADTSAHKHKGAYGVWRQLYLSCNGSYNGIDKMIHEWTWKPKKATQ